MDHLVNWIEIPVSNLPRAKAFYSHLFDCELVDMPVPGLEYAIFPAKSVTNCGALVKGEGYEPSSTGAVLYLDGSGRMEELLGRVTAAGGEVLMPVTRLSKEAGDVAFFRDTEGNRVGLQSPVQQSSVVESAAPQEPAVVTDEGMQRLLGGAAPRFGFVLRPGPKFGPETQALQWEHARNMFTLLRSGKVDSVTALLDGTDVLGLGVASAASKADVEALLRADPGVKGGRLVFEVFTAASFVQGDV